MITLEAGRERLLSAVFAVGTERVELARAHNRVLAEEIVAAGPLPPFDSSAMDGYAVRCAEAVRGARLAVAGVATAGGVFSDPVHPGQCVRIFTGSPLPDGTDAVVMQEDVRPVDSGKAIEFTDAPKPWEHIRFQGEDVRVGDAVLPIGHRLAPQSLGLLAALGVGPVNVFRRPKVIIVPNGSELISPGCERQPAQIHESNSPMLAALVEAHGGTVEVLRPPRDELAEVQQTLRAAFGLGDVVITVGGASVGDLDLIRPALKNLGGRTDFWKLAIKPGKPFLFGTLGEKPLLGLPGNPVSAFVTCVLLVLPTLRKMAGEQLPALRVTRETLGEELANGESRRHFFRVRTDDAGVVRLSGSQASHRMRGLALADGLVDVAPGTTVVSGTQVPVIRW
jgi:molybdopterin molybdotransferase